MTSMQPSPANGDGPREPRGLILTLAGGYMAGYCAALGVGSGVADASPGQTTAVTLVQGAAATLCWVLWRGKQQ